MSTWHRLDNDEKRSLFVAGCLWALFHVFGLGVLVWGGSWSPLVAALFFDAAGVSVAGLMWLAGRLFPDDAPSGTQHAIVLATEPLDEQAARAHTARRPDNGRDCQPPRGVHAGHGTLPTLR